MTRKKVRGYYKAAEGAAGTMAEHGGLAGCGG